VWCVIEESVVCRRGECQVSRVVEEEGVAKESVAKQSVAKQCVACYRGECYVS